MDMQDFELMQYMLNNWDSLMNPQQYEDWYYHELSKYESNKEYYDHRFNQ